MIDDVLLILVVLVLLPQILPHDSCSDSGEGCETPPRMPRHHLHHIFRLEDSLIFQLPIDLEASRQANISSRIPDSKYLGNWMMRDCYCGLPLLLHGF